MNADGSAGVGADLDVGISAPVQELAARFVLISGAVLGLLGIALILIGLGRRRRPALLAH
jgi:hypothetical protein